MKLGLLGPEQGAPPVAKSADEVRPPGITKYSATQVTDLPAPQFQEEIAEVTQLNSAERTPKRIVGKVVAVPGPGIREVTKDKHQERI